MFFSYSCGESFNFIKICATREADLQVMRSFWSIKRNDDFKVNFLVAGTQKGGTTALDTYLRGHPEISMARKKEVHFFDNEENFSKTTNYLKYHANFEKKNTNILYGESTPIYMYWYDAPRRIWEYNPDIKIILTLRNPVERAFSHWNMERDRGAEHMEFFDAVRNAKERCRSSLPYQHRVYSYIDRGFYAEQLRRIYTYFNDQQVLVLKNEELKADVNNELKKLSDFLQIKEFEHVEYESIHSRPYESDITVEERQFLSELYFHDIKILEDMLGWDCADWLS